MAKKLYAIEYAQGVVDDLTVLRVFERKRVLDGVEKQLTYEPMRETRNRKMLHGLIPPWQHVELFGNCALDDIAYSMMLMLKRAS